MPTENERKYVLRMDSEDEIATAASHVFTICQGYLIATRGITVRVRSLKSSKNGLQYYFTLKCTTNNRCIEIEEALDARDFNDLWDISLNKLEKTRYKMNGRHKGWVADFFKDHQDQTYFAMAECEMPEGQQRPDTFPEEIKSAVLFEVPLSDVRFTSKLLGDVRYAKRLLKEIQDVQDNQ